MWRSLHTVLHGRSPLPIGVGFESPSSAEPTAPTPPPLVAPDLIGLAIGEARRVARVAGQPLTVVERSASQGLWGRVLEQEPAAGSAMPPDGTLVLTVGARPHVTVPDVRGRAEDDALSMLREAGLGTARRATRRSDVVPEGHIVRTRPRAGAVMPAGSLVSYVVVGGVRPPRRPPRGTRRRSRVTRMPDGSFLRTGER